MEINVGDYVRTNLGIGTVHRFYNDNGDCYVRFSKNVIKKWVTVTKHSKDIVDLIEVGDYVNGRLVVSIMYDVEDRILGIETLGCLDFENYEIKSVLTKEQYIQNAYTIEKER